MTHSLPKRMLHRYIAIVLVPMLVIYGVAITILIHQMINNEGQRKEYQLALIQRELDSSLKLVETISVTLSQNDALMQYLAYPYQQDWEAVYTYISDIRPPLKYLLSVTPTVSRLLFYGAEHMLNLGGYYRPMSSLPISQSALGTGRWFWNGDALTYLYPRWDSSSNRCSGVISLELSTSVLDELNKIYDDCRLILLDSDGTRLYGLPETGRQKELRLPVSRTALWLALEYSETVLISQPVRLMTMLGILLLLLLLTLSLVYLRFSYRIANRLSRFAIYIRGMRDGEYQPYEGDTVQDEVGEAISAFNDLAIRTDVLVNQVQRAELLRQQAEYNAYQAKIEPHFLYGTLDSIRMLAEENNDASVANMVLQFAKLMRYSLSTESGEVTLGDELQQVRRYLGLQMLRYGQRIQNDFRLDAPELLDMKCPQYILQPLVENSLVHGLKDCVAAGRVTIQLTRCNHFAVVRVADNGVGMPQEQLCKLRKLLSDPKLALPTQGDTGYALFNINMRLRMYFGAESGVYIDIGKSGGLVCTLRMAQRKDSE